LLYTWEDRAMEAFHIFDLPGLIGLCAGSQIWKVSIVGPSLIQISSYYAHNTNNLNISLRPLVNVQFMCRVRHSREGANVLLLAGWQQQTVLV